MKFAKYYNGTKILNQLLKDEKVFSYQEGYYKGVYVCSDVHDMWICRILENMNSDYDTEEGVWLVERNKIDKYELINFMDEEYDVRNRFDRDDIINDVSVTEMIKYVILFDDEQGLENWDNVQCDSLEECIETIDGGYGIIEL